MRHRILILGAMLLPTLAFAQDHCFSPPPKPQLSAVERVAIAKEAARVAEVRRKAKARLERAFARKREQNRRLDEQLAKRRAALDADLENMLAESEADGSGTTLKSASINAVKDHDQQVGSASQRANSIAVDASKAFSESLQRSANAIEQANTLQAIQTRQSGYSSSVPYCPPQPPCRTGSCSIDEGRCK